MRKLIIVCEEKLQRYGDFLAQLISSSDDAAGQVVGLKDGAAAAQVWTEKEYASNAAQISSEQYILFIGNSKLLRDKRMHMQKKYSEYGMNYSWLGKQGILFVDHIVSYEEYDNFYSILSSSSLGCGQPEAIRLIAAKSKNNEQSVVSPQMEIQDTLTEKLVEVPVKDQPVEINKFKKFLTPISENAKAIVRKTADFSAKQFNKMSDDIAVATKSKDIESQEYTCLVLLFYLRDLSTFLGLSET